MSTESATPANDPLGDPSLRRAIEAYVRRRVPAAEVDDVVQTVLVEALASPKRPRDAGELKRWLLGIARHKVVDVHRRAHREPPTELPEIETGPAPIEARELVRWAEEQAGPSSDDQRTLSWMAREGEGEKLEAIAAEEQVPAARVRQRVSRMRRWMKERWSAELAAVATLTLLALAAWWLLHREPEATKHAPDVAPTISPEPPSSLERARALRAEAFEECERSAWRPCLDGLDKARSLDPEGDAAPAVGAARARAEEGLREAPNQRNAPVPDATGKSPPRKGFDNAEPPPQMKDDKGPSTKPSPPGTPGLQGKKLGGKTKGGKEAIMKVIGSDAY